MSHYRKRDAMRPLNLQPIQPYFVLNSALPYLKKTMVDGRIAHFYSFKSGKPGRSVLSVPDASVDILFSLEENAPAAAVYGSPRQPVFAELKADCLYFGVRYRFGQLPDFLPFLPSEFVGGHYDLAEMSHDARLFSERLLLCPDFAARINCYLEHYPNDAPSASPHLSHLISELIISRQGNITIGELSAHTGFSCRAIHHAFTRYYGFSPKTFCLILRFQRALSELTQDGGEIHLSAIAQDLGYADQSHFLREFKRFGGQSPKKFKEALINAHYQQQIVHFN